MSATKSSLLLKISAVLWVIWACSHTAGVIVLTSDAAGGFAAIADAVPADVFVLTYPDAVGGVLNQHGWNLGWFGIATIIGGI